MSSFGSDRNLAAQAQEVLPASQYLQERLQERRARNVRPRRARHTDIGPQRARDDDIFINEAEESRNSRTFESSPLAFNGRSSHGSSGGVNRRRALGIRDMDTHMDRLSKQNFALKLELDHRRDHTTKLQEQIEAMKEQVERAQRLQEEHAELLRINTQLVDELEKRDKAVEEAMDIICDLEDKVAELEENAATETRPSTANADSGYAGTEMHEQVPSSPPELSRVPRTPVINVRRPSIPAAAASHKLQGIVSGPSPTKPKREPMILSHHKPTTQALRSVYLENSKSLHPVKSFHSLLSKRESMIDDEAVVEDIPSSPRLSVLSESSFPSIYSTDKKKLNPDRLKMENSQYVDNALSPTDALAHLRQNSIKRVSQWMSERDTIEGTPSKSNNISTSINMEDRTMPPPPPPKQSVQMSPQEHYKSLKGALGAVSAGPSGLLHSSSSYAHLDRPTTQTKKPRPTSFAGPIFGEPMLPPTPDSASTRMLRASRSSIIDEKSLLDTTPAVVKGYDALQPGVRTAPRQMRSSMELNAAIATYRNAGLGNTRNDSSSDDEDELAENLREFGIDYNDYPDGQSILWGTPSRFLKHYKPPGESVMFDGNDVSSPEATRSPPPQPPVMPQRRRSSADMNYNAGKLRLARAETSPTIFETLGRAFGAGPKTSVESVTSPKSFGSGSSGNRTVTHSEEGQFLSMSPELPRSVSRLSGAAVTSPTKSSPARTLTQKTHMLFRRLSNSAGGDRPEKPAPTSPFVINAPTEPGRPRTSGGSTPVALQRPPSSREQRRPSIHSHVKPNFISAGTSSGSLTSPDDPNSAFERKSLFRRTQSVRATPDVESPTLGSGGKGPTGARRGSLKDAVNTATRRPWRGP